jgi:hypothetical protein
MFGFSLSIVLNQSLEGEKTKKPIQSTVKETQAAGGKTCGRGPVNLCIPIGWYQEENHPIKVGLGGSSRPIRRSLQAALI